MKVRRSGGCDFITNTVIASIVSSYFSESPGAPDIAIRDNAMVHTNYVPKIYQTDAAGISTYPDRNASIVIEA